uniref:Uncharacterized protein n=1 Tax=Meloidogyne hapla TaxID=6305 RepID=A0A1I8BWA2_MELHA
MFLKIIYFFQIFFLLFSHSFSHYEPNQRILVESTEENKDENGNNYVNLMRMEVKYDRNGEGNWEILLEINDKIEINEINLFVDVNDCYEGIEDSWSLLNTNKEIKQNGKEILLKNKFASLFRTNENIIVICSEQEVV